MSDSGKPDQPEIEYGPEATEQLLQAYRNTYWRLAELVRGYLRLEGEPNRELDRSLLREAIRVLTDDPVAEEQT